MRDLTETTFLRTIATQEDQTGRLVLADWLEEQGESDRAEFVRVQCELAKDKLAKKRRQTLRERERALLDAHRQEWIAAFGLPLEDVCFEQGVLTRMRLADWEKGKLLDSAFAPWFVTLQELDLSGLKLNDAELSAFAQTAQFPALRKLLLNGNKITNTGAKALAQAAGLPQLETLYLFDNKVNDPGRTALEKATAFRLKNLDLGEHEDGYCMSPGQTEMARREYLRQHLLPVVTGYFQKYPLLRSAMLCVAQYWADEADDAVHSELIVSELFEPVLEGVKDGYDKEENTDPNVPNTRIKREYYDGYGSVVDSYDAHWDDNCGAIPLWAAFAPEDGSQEYSELSEVYAPAVMFYRHGGYDILPMQRPHLDGVRPEWELE
jgi:uncharacterized protein (TIGR02996 family)